MSSTTTRIELVKQDKSLIKVIFNQKEDTLDVKLCFACNNYYIKSYKLFDESPIIGSVSKNEDVNIEISYHAKKGNLDPKIHFKINEDNGPVYKIVPITRLSSPSIDTFAPFPLFKIEIPDTSLDDFKEVNKSHKKEYRQFDINNDHKVIEVYIISKDSKALERYEPYDKSLRYFTCCNFESFCTNRFDGKKTPFFFKDMDYESIRNEINADLGEFRIIVVTSIFPSLEQIYDRPVITFVENELSEAIFFHSLLKLRGPSVKPGGCLAGNMSEESLLQVDIDDVEKYWRKDSLSNILFRGIKNSEERRIIKEKALEYLEILKIEVMKKETITLYQQRGIFVADDALTMANELAVKLEKDKEILKKNNTEENLRTYKTNEYLMYWLRFDYYNIRSLSSSISKFDTDNGWFIWLKDYSITLSKAYNTIDEENTAIYDKYFDMTMSLLSKTGKQIEEAIYCYKNKKYFACASTLFPAIENIERRITNANPSELFSMSRQLKIPQSDNVVCFNKEYFISFENKMNDFLLNNFYAKSTENDPEPKEINRNRIMHGIFTREVSKTDCLKMFVLTNTLLLFDDWLMSYRKMKEIAEFLDEK